MFANLFAFTKKFEQRFPINRQANQSRWRLYREKGKEIKLSEVFAAKATECAEIAALAQGYAQSEGIPATYFSGEVLWDKGHEFSEPHSFIVIRQAGKTYIWDPANPLQTDQGVFPSVYLAEADFDSQVSRSQKRFVSTKNILSKRVAYFGVSNGTNILPERDIV